MNTYSEMCWLLKDSRRRGKKNLTETRGIAEINTNKWRSFENTCEICDILVFCLVSSGLPHSSLVFRQKKDYLMF